RFHAAQQPAAAPPPAPPIPIFVHPAFPSLLIPSPHQKVILFLGMLIWLKWAKMNIDSFY
ncbi:MAG: hypothetical protein ACK5GA_03395, partial [Holosporaceae bacterium]